MGYTYAAIFEAWDPETGKISSYITPRSLLPDVCAEDMQRFIPHAHEAAQKGGTKGPLCYNNSSTFDVVLMLLKILDMGYLQIDKRDLMMPVQSLMMPPHLIAIKSMVGATWANLHYRHLSLMRHAIMSFCRGHDVPYSHDIGEALSVSTWWNCLAPVGFQATMTTASAYTCIEEGCDFFALPYPNGPQIERKVHQLDIGDEWSPDDACNMESIVQRAFLPHKETSVDKPCPKCGGEVTYQLAVLDRIAPTLVLSTGYCDNSNKEEQRWQNDDVGATEDIYFRYRTADGKCHDVEYRWRGMVHVQYGSHFFVATRVDVEAEGEVRCRVRVYDGAGCDAAGSPSVTEEMNVEEYLRRYSKVDFVLAVYEQVLES